MTLKNYFDGENYRANFELTRAMLPGQEVIWLNALREASISKFVQIGLPGPKVEEWKYSNLNVINSTSYETVDENSDCIEQADKLLEQANIENISGIKVVFVDGYCSDKLSNIQSHSGVSLISLKELLKTNSGNAEKLFKTTPDENSLRNLNIAFMTDGFILDIDDDVKLAEPIQVVHISTKSSHTKALRQNNYIHIGTGASAQVIESFIGPDHINNWSHNVSKIVVEEKASLEVYQFQLEGNETIHMNECVVETATEAYFRHYSLNVGGKLSRTEIKPTLNGLHGQVELRGAFLGRNGNSHDVFTHMKHMVPECNSDQIYRSVLDHGGKSAFQGKVLVAKDAQLTNANQSNKNLLLDRNAEANSKPELLIYADDVKCTHGATVGELDQEALFYLKSRGLEASAAKALMVEAFVAEVYEEIELAPVKEKYLSIARQWLEARD